MTKWSLRIATEWSFGTASKCLLGRGRRPLRWPTVAAAFAAVAAYLVFAASPAGAAGVAATPDTGPPGTAYTVTATGFGLAVTGAPACLSPFTIVFQTTGGSVIQTLYSGAPPTSNSQPYGSFAAPNVAASTYEIFAKCPEPTAGPPVNLTATNYFILQAPPPPTTTTTTTAPPTTTTTHPVVVTTTTRPSGGTTTTTVKAHGSTTTSSSSTTTTTTKPGTPATTTTTTAPRATEALLLSTEAIPPAGAVSATGHGCTGGSTVVLTVDKVPVGTTKADSGGSFSTPLNVGSLAVGQYQVVADCGIELMRSDLTVVLGTQANPDTSTLLIIIFFLLVGLALFRRRIRLDAPAATPGEPEDDEGVTSV